MEKTRKAFVVLAAAVTAGDLGACSSDTESRQDLKYADAATVDTKAPGTDTKASDPAPVRDAGTVDAVATQPKIDAQSRDVGVDLGQPDTRPVATEPDAMLADAGLEDAVAPDARADTLRLDALVRLDASVSPPDTRPPLTMPAGTAYDVISRAQLA